METNQTQESSTDKKEITAEEMVREMYEYTRKTYMFMKWQFYITIVLVVLPLLGIAFLLPQVLKGLSGAYLQGLQ